MKRRDFIQQSLIAGMSLPLLSSSFLSSCQKSSGHSEAFRQMVFELLKDWCDGMIRTQIINPSDPTVHGLFDCPSCEHLHARVMDSVYPFFYMAKATGDEKYLEAGIAAFEWGENVSREDGAWTNELDPKSWDGTTVFAAVALAETLKYHDDLLDDDRREKWYKRLEEATHFVYHRFPIIGNANINYGATTIYALNLIGKLLNKPEYVQRSKELASQIKSHFTTPNHFIFGEKQGRDKKKLSRKGLYGIDLGYNVEETLNSLVMYAFEESDEELLDLVTKSMNTHLEFMLPDGGWDNSWGTRMFKWTYWGSRTSDGSQQCLTLLAGRNPACGTAVVKYTELLKRCTDGGLLHGGLHYVRHGIKPCIHHTFEHAKPLAFLLEHWEHLPEITTITPLPRAAANGIKHYKEIDTSLFARGPWRGTITAYDAIYSIPKQLQQATGAALSLLYHHKVGLLCVASMPVYKLGEAYNQQEAPGEDIALTPRLETYKDGVWYTNLFDLAATFTSSDKDGEISFLAKTILKNEKRQAVEHTASGFEIRYNCTEKEMQIEAETSEEMTGQTAFVLPIISPTGEKMSRPNANEVSIEKPEGLLKVSANVPLKIKAMPQSRTFNMIPGLEAVPIVAYFEKNKNIHLRIEVV